jgi:hypothetical protein
MPGDRLTGSGSSPRSTVRGARAAARSRRAPSTRGPRGKIGQVSSSMGMTTARPPLSSPMATWCGSCAARARTRGRQQRRDREGAWRRRALGGARPPATPLRRTENPDTNTHHRQEERRAVLCEPVVIAAPRRLARLSLLRRLHSGKDLHDFVDQWRTRRVHRGGNGLARPTRASTAGFCGAPRARGGSTSPIDRGVMSPPSGAALRVRGADIRRHARARVRRGLVVDAGRLMAPLSTLVRPRPASPDAREGRRPA